MHESLRRIHIKYLPRPTGTAGSPPQVLEVLLALQALRFRPTLVAVLDLTTLTEP